MNRTHVTVASAALAVAVAAWAWHAGSPPAPLPIQPPAAEAVDSVGSSIRTVASPGESVTVYVSGAVVSPGLVSVAAGARYADAVAAAGGATSDAALSAVNLAAVVADGLQIVVPSRDDPEAGTSGGDADRRVAVNRASAADLEELPGVGPVLAERIIAHRRSFGPFQTPEDLLDVPGIGEATLGNLRESIVVP